MKRTLLLLASLLPFSAHAALTLYTTGWSMYGKGGYEYDGAYKNNQPYGSLSYVSNPDMVAQFNKADVVAWSFMQVWNSKHPQQAQYGIPQAWDGLMHFDDLWGELPYEASWAKLPKETAPFLDFCNKNQGACASVQVNGNTGVKELFNYTDQKGVGQLNSFGAFINSDKYTAKRIIAIGGANLVENQGLSTATFDAIFANQDTFLTQYKGWMDAFKNLKGVDYDFEPPIDLQTGAQLPANDRTRQDYIKLFNLVKATRAKLGKDAYISVTLTVDKDYLETINGSIANGWFKEIAPLVDSVNLMTYDLHGPWGHSADPYTAVHSYVKQPNSSRKDEFGIRYGVEEITDQVLSYGIPSQKLQVGLASYGRGFANVPTGEDKAHPGFEQPWEAPSQFSENYTKQSGLLPYKSVDKVISELGYSRYDWVEPNDDGEASVLGSYIYNPNQKQWVGFESPEMVKAICKYVKSRQLGGAILWSADTDLPVSDAKSLVATFKQCDN